MRFDRKGLIDFGKRLKDGVAEDDVSGAAAEMAYRFFLALFPFFIFLAALGGYAASLSGVQDPTGEIMDMIGDSLPEDSSAVLRTQLEAVLQERNAGLMSIGILGAIWAASSGVGALMKNMNRIHGVNEDRSTPVRIAIALGLTIMGAGVLVLAFVILFTGQLYGPEIAAEVGLKDTAASLLGWARWPVALALILFAVAFLYWLTPNAKLHIKWITPGAVFFGLTWIVATFGFGIYVANFSSYNETYGTLGGVVILLIWFYLTSFLLLLGAEINGILAERAAEDGAREVAATLDEDGDVVEPDDNAAVVPKSLGVAVAGLIWGLALIHTLRKSG